ncbi:verrucotoxin subunit beta-like [Homarus americanus]|uniref:verrucotoxin subunit beta-like n=1 Tax=Homarus americanus TaxID=6706 RepID=UPI001C48505A|nr:verrucotoxin subunit beta-like [Homarus americanus]
MADSKKDTLEILAVGRPFQLGMLYDCRNEKLIPGITLWDPDILKGNINSSKKPSVEYDVIISDSIDDKSSAMDISASMKASFCSGLIDISGSASYLSNQKQLRHQSRVTLKYKTTTRFEQLTMQHLGKSNAKHQDVFDQGTATHVVTGILYGAQAFFVFDRKFSESSEEQEIKGDLEVMINKIPSVKISGDGNLNMNDGERSKVEEFHCQFHGDFIIDTNPVNYEDAVKLYHDLPNKVGKDGTNGVPLKVWLYPLHLLDSSAAKLVRDISVNVISNVSSAYEELVNLESQLNDLKGHTVPCKFTSIKDKMTWFQKMVTEFKTHFQRNLAESLPRIRGGGMEEQVLVDLLLRCDKSPFSTEKLVKWISNLEHEINLMEAYLENLKDIHQVTKAGEIDRLATRNEHVFCFTFGQLSQSEPLLLSMSSYLAGGNVKETTEDKKAWFHNPAIKKCIRKRSMQFADFVNATRPTLDSCFVVSSSDDGEKTVGARVIHYKEGEVVDSDFKPPSAPGKPSIDSVDHDQVSLTWEEPENGCCNVESYSIKFTDLGCTDDPRTHTHEVEKGTSATVNNMKPNTQYVFEIIAKCDGGLSPASIKSDVVLTKPCSPPGIPSQSNALSSELAICWKQPTVIAKGEVIKLYKVKCLCIVNNQVVAEESTSTSTLFTNLMPSTEYTFSVTAVCSSGTSNSSGAITMETLSNISTTKLISAKLLVPRTHKGSPEIYAIPLEENMRNTEKYL